MAQHVLFAEVVLPLPVGKTYTYLVPEGLAERCNPGMRVIAQFGSRKFYTGLIVSLHDRPPPYPVKPIFDLLDEVPLVCETQFGFWDWMSTYYMCSLGEVFIAALPAGLKLQSTTRLRLCEGIDEEGEWNEKERVVLKNLASKESLTLEEVADLLDQKSCASLVKGMIEKGLIVAGEVLNPDWKPKMETLVTLEAGFEQEEKLEGIFNQLAKAPAQHKLIVSYLSEIDWFNRRELVAIPRLELLKRSGVSIQVYHQLVKKGIFVERAREVGRLHFSGDAGLGVKPLSAIQGRAFQQISDCFLEKDVCLLHGVTSSGKTEIYFHLIQKVLNAGKQVLFLLPEIALTTQMISRVREVFGSSVGVYHSKFSDVERVEIWRNLMGMSVVGETYQVIVGVRSAVFLPFKNLGLIIVDEEHEPSYKQQQPAPRYNARDSALFLARMLQAKVLLGSATPSLETYSHAVAGRYGMVELNTRHLNLPMPEILVSDRKAARKKKTMKAIFTPELFNAISEAMEKGEQVILFQNRRGFAPYLECPECGFVVKCEQCDVSLTYHRAVNALVCHYCSSAHPVPQTCLACGHPGMLTKGMGTERVEEEIALLFPEVRVERMDIDSTRAKHAFEKLLEGFENGEIQILVGTQMVSKGLDFDAVSVVGILDADSLLNFPDFRAFERGYQMMSQVSGRAGRKKGRGKVIIQTSMPDHIIIRQVVESDYRGMFNAQSIERYQFGYPPYTRLIRITFKHKDPDLVDFGADWFAKSIRQGLKDRVIGPDFPLVPRIQNVYYKTLLVKIEKERSPHAVKQYLWEAWRYMKSDPDLKKLQVFFDVDPL